MKEERERKGGGVRGDVSEGNGCRNKDYKRRRKYSRRSCRDSNLRPFDHESGALKVSYHCSPVTACVVCLSPLAAVQQRARVSDSISIVKLEVDTFRLHCLPG